MDFDIEEPKKAFAALLDQVSKSPGPMTHSQLVLLLGALHGALSTPDACHFLAKLVLDRRLRAKYLLDLKMRIEDVLVAAGVL